MFKCNVCAEPFYTHHQCPGFVVVREQEPVFSDNWSATLWNVRELRKELAELRAELRGNRGPVKAFAAHWAEHD